MKDLIERIETATMWDAGLDFDIRMHLEGLESIGGYRARVIATGEHIKIDYGAPQYTASIDAAFSMLPEDWFLTLDRYIVSDQPEPNPLTWRVWLKHFYSVDPADEDSEIRRLEVLASGVTPAHAIAAAALKARASLSSQLREKP